MSDDYDYERYEEIIMALLADMLRDPDYLTVGENISDIPSVKIIFDGWGDLSAEDEDEDGEFIYVEGGNKNLESYAVFIHRDSDGDDFEFPEHDTTPWGLIHRPREEVCIHAWYDVEQDSWDIMNLDDRSFSHGDGSMTNGEVMTVLEAIWTRWFNIQ